jgi:hypothetical protein
VWSGDRAVRPNRHVKPIAGPPRGGHRHPMRSHSAFTDRVDTKNRGSFDAPTGNSHGLDRDVRPVRPGPMPHGVVWTSDDELVCAPDHVRARSHLGHGGPLAWLRPVRHLSDRRAGCGTGTGSCTGSRTRTAGHAGSGSHAGAAGAAGPADPGPGLPAACGTGRLLLPGLLQLSYLPDLPQRQLPSALSPLG